MDTQLYYIHDCITNVLTNTITKIITHKYIHNKLLIINVVHNCINIIAYNLCCS